MFTFIIFGVIWENIIPHNFIWWNCRQMILPFVEDVNATVLDSYNFLVVDGVPLCFIVLMFGILVHSRWYCLCSYALVDVMANVW